MSCQTKISVKLYYSCNSSIYSNKDGYPDKEGRVAVGGA